VEVVYALRGEQALVALEVEEGTSAREAIERSGILKRYPEITLGRGHIGIFGKAVEPDSPLRNGDRVEIYRPLIADPKQARRARAERRKRARPR
jgi:putative ubiquitin-RnfH superfamily antitoxin RatB of RatAB toxin-antitoxin module